jgi:flagellar hook-associated protein 2
MAGITTSGLGSGLDINSLVSQLVTAERTPAVNRLASQESKLKTQISAIGSFKSVLSNFKSALASLMKADSFQSMKSTVADDKLFSVTTSNDAQAGAYDVKVQQLAQAQRLATPAAQAFASPSAVVGTGTLTFQFGSYDSATNSFTANPDKATKSITIDASNNTLAGLRDALNKANIGVIASIVNDGSGYRLVMGAKDSGVANSLKITASDDDGGPSDTSGLSLLAYDPTAAVGAGKNLTETVAAANARIVIDGLTVNSATNTVKEAIPGLTLDLKAVGATATHLTVAQDSAETAKSIDTFVKSYNDMMSTVKSLTGYNPQTKIAGTLAGDYNVRSTINRIRDVFTNSVTGVSGSFKSLADIGIKLQNDGTLQLDNAKLEKVLGADPEGVASLFARTGTTTDPLVSYTDSTSASKAGSYDLTVGQLATQGTYTGTTVDTSTALTIDSTNNTFALTVDGAPSNTITLSAGSYTAAGLAAELQSRINGDTALQAAGGAVNVAVGVNAFSVSSTRYGAHSTIEFTAVGNSIQTTLGFHVGAGTSGQDVQGSFDGVAATGSGRSLTGSSGGATGLSVDVLGGAAGVRGKVSLSNGIAQQLDSLLTDVLGSAGPLDSRTGSLNKQMKEIGEERDHLNVRLSALEARYRSQFAAMDRLVSQLTATGNYLTQQLSGLSGR